MPSFSSLFRGGVLQWEDERADMTYWCWGKSSRSVGSCRRGARRRSENEHAAAEIKTVNTQKLKKPTHLPFKPCLRFSRYLNSLAAKSIFPALGRVACFAGAWHLMRIDASRCQTRGKTDRGIWDTMRVSRARHLGNIIWRITGRIRAASWEGIVRFRWLTDGLCLRRMLSTAYKPGRQDRNWRGAVAYWHDTTRADDRQQTPDMRSLAAIASRSNVDYNIIIKLYIGHDVAATSASRRLDECLPTSRSRRLWFGAY